MFSRLSEIGALCLNNALFNKESIEPDPSASCGKVDPVFRKSDALFIEWSIESDPKSGSTFGSDALKVDSVFEAGGRPLLLPG